MYGKRLLKTLFQTTFVRLIEVNWIYLFCFIGGLWSIEMDLLIATLWMRHFEMLLTTTVVVPLFLSLSLSLETILNYMYEREYNNYISCNTRGINSRTRMLTWNIINSPMAYILIENENQWSNLKRQCLFWIRITQAQQVRERILCTVRFHDWFAGKKWNFKKQPTHKS